MQEYGIPTLLGGWSQKITLRLILLGSLQGS